MAIKKPLDKVFNVGPFEIGGDTDTVHQSSFNPLASYHATSWCSSNRIIMVVGNCDACIGISHPGQSGLLGSDHYSDMADLWLKEEYVPLYWSGERMEENKVSTLNIRTE